MLTEKKSRKPVSDAIWRQCNRCKEFKPWASFRNKKSWYFNKWSICKQCYKEKYYIKKYAIQVQPDLEFFDYKVFIGFLIFIFIGLGIYSALCFYFSYSF